MTCGESRRGFTLLELVVVLAILGIVALVSVPALQTGAVTPSTSTFQATLTHLRDSALKTGAAVTADVVDSVAPDSVHFGTATAFPDGTVLSSVGPVEWTTGKVRATTGDTIQ